MDPISIFGTNAFRATETYVVLPLLKAPVQLIEEHCATWEDFLNVARSHPAVDNACRASSYAVQAEDCRYANNYHAAGSTSFSNRFDRKLYDSVASLIKAREEAKKARDEHEAIVATRPPPTPPPEEFVHEGGNNNNNAGGEDENEDENNDGDGYDDENQGGGYQQDEVVSPAPRPRKTRAQRREEEKQKKEDAKRQFEVEKKEHLVACLEQKLSNALSADSLKIVLGPN